MYKALNYWVFGGFAGEKTPYEFIDWAAKKGLDGVELTVGDVIPANADEILLLENKEKIQEFLDKGGIIISFTQNYLEWLPGNSLYQASSTPIKDRSVVSCAHPITEGVKEYDMNYRCGVKGFFNRGFFKAPVGATVILKDSDGECVAYIDSATTKGVILSTAGADLVGFGLAESSTAKRLGVNLMLWLEKTMKEREAA